MRKSAPTWLLGVVVAALTACEAPIGSPWAQSAWLEIQDPAQEPTPQKPNTAKPSVEKAPTATPALPQATPQEKAKWTPPVPDTKDFDWIQLKSGEWLKGEIMSLRRRTLEFDSVEMNRLTIDWADVATVRSPRINSVIYKDRETARGPLLIRDDLVIVGGPEGETRFPRKEIYSIVGDDERELSHWDGKVTLGLASQSGNVDQLTVNTQGAIKRRTTFSRISLDYNGYYSEVDGLQNANNHRARGAWSRFLSRRLYVTPFSLDFFSDKFQNIKYQLTPASGIGYALVDEPIFEWDVGAGAGVRYTRFESVEANEDQDDYTLSILPYTRLDWDVTKKIEFELVYRMEIGVPETRDTNQHLIMTLSVDVIGDLDLDVTFQWDRVGAPERDSNGDFPDNDDFRTSVGVSLEF